MAAALPTNGRHRSFINGLEIGTPTLPRIRTPTLGFTATVEPELLSQFSNLQAVFRGFFPAAVHKNLIRYSRTVPFWRNALRRSGFASTRLGLPTRTYEPWCFIGQEIRIRSHFVQRGL